MPGNELGDRVHNFFAQENASQGQHQSPVVEGNWPGSNNNFWVGSSRPVDVLNSSKNFSGQNSEIDRVQSSYPVHTAHGMNLLQSNLRPDFSRSRPLNENQYSNGYMYGNQLSQNRQNEANFREPNTYSDQRHLLVSRGLPVHELQRISSHEQQPKASDKSETSVSPVSFDLFGGQQQVNHQQASMLQALQHQQSGLNDMQQLQLQQQFMFRKMEELQRHYQFQQPDLKPQNPMNQVHPSIKQSSGSQSSLFNGTPNSDVLRNSCSAEPGTNWLGRGSSAMQGSSSGISFLPNLGQEHRLMDVAHQQVDESLYGVPVSNSRGLAVNQYSPMVNERASVSQMPASSNSLHSNQLNFWSDRHTREEGTSISRQNIQNETNKHASGQSLNTGIMDMGFHQRTNPLQSNATLQDHAGRQELATLSETSHDRFTVQVSSPQNENTLDPAEEKILYGSDDNIWSAFGKIPSVSGETVNLFDNSGISNNFPSIQSGSWSALMQSAVAETSTADIGPQEEWSSLNCHSNVGPSANQPPLIHNENKQSSLPSDSVRIPSAMGAESIRSSNKNTLNPMGLNQLGHTFQREPTETVQIDVSQRFGQSMAVTSEWLNHSKVQNSLANENDIHGNASDNALGADKNGKAILADWPPGLSGTRPQQANGWNALAAESPSGDRALNILDAEKVSQNSQNNQVRVMQEQMVDGGSLWKSSPLTSAAELGTVRSMTGSHQPNKSKGDFSLHDAAASEANSCNVVSCGVNPYAQNNYLLNHWKHSSDSSKFQGGEGLRRMMDQVHDQNQGSWKSSDKDETTNYNRENYAMKDNSNDSHRSNLSSHVSGGSRECRTVDAIDSRVQFSGKPKSSNQVAKKGSAPRKFQFHPMGNLDDDAGPTHVLKQPTQAQAISQQNAHFGPLKLFGQVPRNPAEKGVLPKDCKQFDKEPSGSTFPGPGTSNLFSRSYDSSTSKASTPGQNMLELLHKVDQSRDHDSLMHVSSSERNLSSQPPEAEKPYASAGRLQHSQSSLSQGFGLQLGPPSQLMQTPDLSSSSQNAQSMVNAMHTSYAGAGMGERSILMASPSQSRQITNEKIQMEYENDTSAGPRHPGHDNSVSKVSDNYHSAFTSDTPYVQSQLQNKQVTRLSTRVAVNQHIDSSLSYNSSHSMERGSIGTVLPDASGNLQKDNPPSGDAAQQSNACDAQAIGQAGSASSRDQVRDSQHFGLPGTSQQGSSSQVSHKMWTNVSTPQHTLGGQYLKGPTHFHEPPHPTILESSTHGDLDAKGGHVSSKSAAIHADTPVGVNEENHRLKENLAELASGSKIEVSLGSALPIKNHLDESPADSASTQKVIEDFGRSLKPNTFSNEKFSLLNQMRALKNAVSDPSIRFPKRVKGPENVHDIHQAHVMAEKQSQDDFRNSLASSSGVPPEDSRVVSFSSPSDMLQSNTFPNENADLEDVAAVVGRHDSQSMPPDDTAVRIEHQMVSPQMAPSWFNQYGSFKDGQLLHLQNVRHATSPRPEETPFTLGMSSSVMDTPYLDDKPTAALVDTHEVTGSLKSCAPTVKENEHLSSLSSQHQVILKPKKRKTATSELLSWYKEISHCSRSPILSVVEADWSKAVNCLTEKIEDCVDLIEDGPQMLRSKRRLILTTQLMQQIFCPLPTTVLSADASSECESVAYAASRIALGDACSALSTSSNLGLPQDGIDLHAVKRTPNGDPHFAKAFEDQLVKATKLENDFLRLDKSASLLDLRLECQDLEKFSVINRFAKFHGRGQTDNAETSSIVATATTHKPCAQRYVTAVPMPRNLPDMLNGTVKFQEDGHEVSSNVLDAL